MELVDKKILVTGGSGFIGSSLVNALKGTNLVTSLDLVERQKESIDFNFVKGHAKDIVEIFADHSFDIVYHLADIVAGINFVFDVTPPSPIFLSSVMRPLTVVFLVLWDNWVSLVLPPN